MPSPFEWSGEMDSIWNSICRIILEDPRTDWSENLSLGYPFEVIREQVLAKGLADFSKGHEDNRYGPLTAEEKVILYCFVNLKKHFFACLATYEAHRAAIEELLVSERSPLVLDVGCGPATACLALTDLFPGRRFDYLGIDSSPAMRTRARRLWEAACEKGLVGEGSTPDFKESWDEVDVDQVVPATTVLIVFSYLFASHTLTFGTIRSLADFVHRLAASRTTRPLVTVYMNSTNPLANRNYEVFKQLLGFDPAAGSPVQLSIEYRKKKGSAVTGREEFVHEMLRLKGK